MNINLKVNTVNSEYVRCSLFINGVSCGTLCFKIDEYQLFNAIIGLGTQQTGSHHTNSSDDEVFTQWLIANDSITLTEEVANLLKTMAKRKGKETKNGNI